MIRKCPPCGIEFVVSHAKQDRCTECTRRVEAEVRRVTRFDRSKALDGWRPAA